MLFSEIMTIQMLGGIITLSSFILFVIDLFGSLFNHYSRNGKHRGEMPSGRFYFTELHSYTEKH